MNVLLTGGAGYIGSHTAAAFIAQGHGVVVADNFSNSSPEALTRIARITGVKPVCHAVDVSDPSALETVFAASRIDAVVHFAGLKAVGESVAVPLKYYRNNIDTTLTLLESMAKFGVKKLIFSSSATVYGTPEALPLTEDMPTQPESPYGWTKLMIERIITDYAASDPGFSAVLLRYFNPVGAHPSGLIGEDPRQIPNNLMPYIAQVAAGKLPALNIFGNDYPTKDGTGVRDYIHVADLARGHVAALDRCREHPGAEIFNLGTGTPYSVMEVVRAFEAASGVAVPCRIAPRRGGDIAIYYADPAKANRALGWQAQYGLSDMCRDAWRFQTQNPNGYADA
jgi:UDP-glucose 4-epimerase